LIWRNRNDPLGDDAGGMEQPPGEGAPDGVGSRVESIIEAAEQAAAGIRADAEERARQYLEETRRRVDGAASQRMEDMSHLTDALIQRARAVAQQSDQLLAALEDAGRRVIGNSTPPQGQAPPPPPAPQAAPPAVQPSAPAPPPPPAAAPPAPEPPPPPPPAPAPPPPPPPPQPQAAPPPPPPPPQPEQRPEPPPPTPAPAAANQVPAEARLLATQMAVAGSSREDIVSRLRDEYGVTDVGPLLEEIGV
jgi:hypothetical protein